MSFCGFNLNFPDDNDVEHFPMSFGQFIYLLYECLLKDTWFSCIFLFLPVACLFISFMVSFDEQKFYILMKANLFIFL